VELDAGVGKAVEVTVRMFRVVITAGTAREVRGRVVAIV
jgi:hypothetical protein